MMRVPLQEMQEIVEAVGILTDSSKELRVVTVTQFQHKNHTVFLDKDSEGEYVIRGIDTKSEADKPGVTHKLGLR